MSNSIVTKADLEQRLSGVIAGTQKHSPNGSLTFGGATYTAAALEQLFQGLLDALSAADAARAAWQDALMKVRDTESSVVPVLRGYVKFLVASNGSAPSTLADYGITPPKARTPLTAEQQAAAAAKNRATRAARHTLGSKQKKAIKGTVATAPASVAPSPAPTASTPHATPPTPAA